MIAPEAVVTFEQLEGYRVVRSFGVVRGEGIMPRNVFRTTFRAIGSLIGLGPVEYVTAAERARAQSLAALLAQAERAGANGVVRLSFDATERPDGATRVLAYGEAVLLEPSPGRTLGSVARDPARSGLAHNARTTSEAASRDAAR